MTEGEAGKGTHTMTDKKMRLPKENLVEPEERGPAQYIGTDDVEGHGLPVTPPPAMPNRSPGHGGEVVSDDQAGPDDLVRQ
jgi:hypothetical protein